MSADGHPNVQVTMVGNTGTGKTTYLVGMYAEMSAGVKNFFLTSDHNTHVHLTSTWGAILEKGLLPSATGDSKTYEFTFRYGAAPLLAMDWIDYRGGAVRQDTDDAVTKELNGRLPASDSLYFTVDGALLAQVLDGNRGAEHRLRALTADYNNMIAYVMDARREANLIPPSTVLLVTKSDLLIDHLSGDARERRRTIRDWIADRFALALQADRDVAVCAVSLGELGDSRESKVDEHRIDPVHIHKPMVFTLYSYYRRAARYFEGQAEVFRQQGDEHANELETLRGSGVARLLGRKRVQHLSEQHGQSRTLAQTMRDLAGECLERTRHLEHELLDVDTFIDGAWLEAH